MYQYTITLRENNSVEKSLGSFTSYIHNVKLYKLLFRTFHFRTYQNVMFIWNLTEVYEAGVHFLRGRIMLWRAS